ncbi:octanoyltransferase [Acidihalobacter aeolianus]|uniref:Octanoyltransferase n=1 Tax=Acidihalobacter aeolianus TaxID=2792603 RepID=A0A1D8KBT3_9GAMM|nr:octanoyltransferase [Acidihalobacter aeolianus]
MRVHYLGRRDYASVWQSMRDYTDARDAASPDEFWIVEHPPVFTQGQAGRPEHLLDPGDIPVVQSDRGGQVTYHGLGQVVVYTLLDLRRLRFGVRVLVENLELAVVDLLAGYGVEAAGRRDAPGVYVGGRKIAALGLRVRHGCTYHGLALNVDLDPAPFARINPCGYQGLEVARLADFGIELDVWAAGHALSERLARRLGYTAPSAITDIGTEYGT